MPFYAAGFALGLAIGVTLPMLVLTGCDILGSVAGPIFATVQAWCGAVSKSASFIYPRVGSMGEFGASTVNPVFGRINGMFANAVAWIPSLGGYGAFTVDTVVGSITGVADWVCHHWNTYAV